MSRQNLGVFLIEKPLQDEQLLDGHLYKTDTFFCPNEEFSLLIAS